MNGLGLEGTAIKTEFLPHGGLENSVFLAPLIRVPSVQLSLRLLPFPEFGSWPFLTYLDFSIISAPT